MRHVLFALCILVGAAGLAQAAQPRVTPPVELGDPNSEPPADDAHCTTCDGMRLLSRGEYGRALHIFQLRSAAGDLVATNELGVMYEEGFGVPVNYERARGYYAKAAKAGGARSMVSLGWMYEQGHGSAVDFNQARRYYAMAKDAGDPLGASRLGYLYQHGSGVSVDYAKAMSLYHQAIAKGGDLLAMEQIGFMLQHGLGAPPRPAEAWCWYSWADANGQPNAAQHLSELALAGQQPVEDCSVLNQWPIETRAASTGGQAQLAQRQTTKVR